MKKILLFIIFLAIFLIIHFPFYLYGSNTIILDTVQYDKEKGKPETYTNTFSVRDTSLQYTIHVWQGENGENMARNGSITLNGVEIISSKELRNGTGYISKTVNLQLNNTLSVELKGKSEVFLRVKITGATGPMDPTITISSPSHGDTINRKTVLVSGAIHSNVEEISVKVNGRLAEVNGDNYFINDIPLKTGQNLITAQIIEAEGYKAEESITIKTDTQVQPLKLSSNIVSGIPPLNINFRIDTDIPHTITSFRMDYDGDGIIDYTADNADNISFTYNTSGIYYAAASITDDQGKQYCEKLGINVISREELDGLLKRKWAGFGDSLREKDIQKALSYLVNRSQGRYEQGFILLMDQLPAIFSMTEGFNPVSIIENTAIYENVVNEGEVTMSYPVTFIKDENGFWKIKGF